MNRFSTPYVLGLAAVIAGPFFASGCSGAASIDHRDAAYVIGGRQIELRDGVSDIEAVPGSASRIVTRYVGGEASGDLNGDGREDRVFVLTQETSGTGVFYYVVAALATQSGYRGSHGLLLGDRIALRTVEIGADDIVLISYADHALGASFATAPAVAKTIRLRLDADALQFAEVEQSFEDEADPTAMSLEMKTWIWIGALAGDGRRTAPKEAGPFTLAFEADGSFVATTDCNRIGGAYTVHGDRLRFDHVFATRMYCEGSQEGEFADLLQRAATYRFDSRGQLILSLALDGGTVTFR